MVKFRKWMAECVERVKIYKINLKKKSRISKVSFKESGSCEPLNIAVATDMLSCFCDNDTHIKHQGATL